jgi:hypothetical protein
VGPNVAAEKAKDEVLGLIRTGSHRSKLMLYASAKYIINSRAFQIGEVALEGVISSKVNTRRPASHGRCLPQNREIQCEIHGQPKNANRKSLQRVQGSSFNIATQQDTGGDQADEPRQVGK